MEIKFKRYSENAIVSLRATAGSSGYDLYSAVNIRLIPFQLVKTDVMLEIPKGFYAKVVERSGLAFSGVSTHVGTVDSGFRGVECVIQKKFSGCRTSNQKSDRISQIIFEKNEIVKLLECSTDEELSKTERGSKGFGSTGK